MKLVNETPFPALMARSALPKDRVAAALVLRATFDVGSRCKPAIEQPWRVSPTAWQGPQGEMEPDAIFDRDGCDILVFGKARSPNGKPRPTIDVLIGIGDFRYQLRVFGDRIWTRRDDHLIPSEPAPFLEMPIDLSHAYGGKTLYDELEVPCTDNPLGKGFYLEEEIAEGNPLPNLENPNALIHKWDDRPEPVGVGICPLTCGLRVRRAVLADAGGRARIRPKALHNVAFPALIQSLVDPGARVQITGMNPETLAFALPRDAFIATTRVGKTEHVDPLRIDQVGLELEQARVFITYRYTFTYPLRGGDDRRCVVRWSPEGETI